MKTQPRIRVVATVLYALLLVALQYSVVVTGLLPNENSIWLYNGVAGLLFGSRILNPYFTPPADAATNAFAALTSLIAGALVVAANTPDALLLCVSVALSGAILLAAVMVLILRPPLGVLPNYWLRVTDSLVRQVGAPNVIFTLVILEVVWLFHRDRPDEVFAIISAWTVITVLRPLEAIFDFISTIQISKAPASPDIVGVIAAYQSPNIALIRQSGNGALRLGDTLLVAGDRSDWLLGVALNYVGRDEGNLLRVLTAPLPSNLQTRTPALTREEGNHVALSLPLSADDAKNISMLERIDQLRGVVDKDSTLEYLQFEVIDERGLSEGRLVEARIGDQRRVLFQVVEGVTHEEVVQQKNKYGYARARARKIGYWDSSSNSFKPVSWLPSINAPVFLIDAQTFLPQADAIGHFPGTSYGVALDISEAVTHNTAILGILGIGKSYLSIEMVERMIAANIKVLCLDLTNQYQTLLSPFVEDAHEAAQNAGLAKAGLGGKPHQNREQGGSRQTFKAAVVAQMQAFMADQQHHIRVLNPSQFDVTRQVGGMYQSNAELATLTASEITAIFSDAALFVCQQLGMTEKARLCIVYEEAHSLVPEWNSVASEGDKAATATSARAILQGRKYGLGCLLITQRTANVTKTILNQCNTILAMRTFDDTGKEFLSNYIGRDYAGVLPSMEARHAVVFGKASSCKDPVLVRLNDRTDFIAAFR